MERRGDAAEDEQHQEVAEVERGGLEDALHEWHVDERELREERDRDGRDEHLVLREPAAKPPILQRGDQVEEDEAREGLQLGVKILIIMNGG